MGKQGEFMRATSFGAAVCLMLLAGCASTPSAVYAVETTSTSEAATAASLISAYRTSHGLSPVTVDARLNRAAEHQVKVVAAAGRLTHGNFGERMGQFGISGSSAENLSAGQSTVAEAVATWKASPRHNENLLLPEIRRVGLARADSKSGYGRYWTLVLSQ
jgi:uncharacterized protein YkwD